MKQFIALLVVLATSSWLSASTPIVPNTTLAAETSNNTSAASTFTTQSNGNLGATNISKVSIKSLLYPGFSGKVYAHLMPWFGSTSHMNIGYESNSSTQVAKQVSDMASRGIDGVIVDWYGPNNTRSVGVTKYLRAEAEKRPGFEFAVMEDVGALKSCANTSGCNVTTQMISDLTYAYNNYEGSSAYMRYSGRPVVFFFGVERYSIDWARVKSSVPGNPLFIQRNASAFTNSNYSGAFAWVTPNASNPADIGTTYLSNFYNAAIANSGDRAFGTTYKGFNDKLAAWSANRVMNQNCGQTWLSTFAQINSKYSTSRQLYAIQLGTWNDYEEATELESGIENCVSISASASGSKVSWTVSGSQNTLDHYTVFISTDGTNLMTVGNVPKTQTSYDFSGYALAAGSYKVFVKAVGVATMRNHMSSAVPMTIGTGNQAPTAKLAVTPTSGAGTVTVNANTAGSTDPDGYITKTSIAFGDGATATATSASHVYSTPGTYTVTATVTDNSGVSSKATATVTVGSATTANGVTITSPTANATISGAVTFSATAKAANPIASMRLYVDSVSKYTTSGASLNTTQTLSTGTHAVTVQAWDSVGNVYKSSLSIAVK